MPGLDLWYKNAVVYSVDVETFMDGNGDGVGDFTGLTQRLDYLASLGFTCIWLLPFYPTPNRDNGYDILDFYGVDPRLGTLGDFVEFEHQARMRGIRVIIDLVVNHTSSEHPWFQAAREDPASPYRDYYIWAEQRPAHSGTGMVFPGVQESTWTYDRKARAWYHHRFFAHQPDLNVKNPLVRDEIRKIMGFWLELGVSGFRVDAVPFIIEDTEEDEPEAPLVYSYSVSFGTSSPGAARTRFSSPRPMSSRSACLTISGTATACSSCSTSGSINTCSSRSSASRASPSCAASLRCPRCPRSPSGRTSSVIMTRSISGV